VTSGKNVDALEPSMLTYVAKDQFGMRINLYHDSRTKAAVRRFPILQDVQHAPHSHSRVESAQSMVGDWNVTALSARALLLHGGQVAEEYQVAGRLAWTMLRRSRLSVRSGIVEMKSVRWLCCTRPGLLSALAASARSPCNPSADHPFA
jgi:hypothetical protein